MTACPRGDLGRYQCLPDAYWWFWFNSRHKRFLCFQGLRKWSYIPVIYHGRSWGLCCWDHGQGWGCAISAAVLVSSPCSQWWGYRDHRWWWWWCCWSQNSRHFFRVLGLSCNVDDTQGSTFLMMFVWGDNCNWYGSKKIFFLLLEFFKNDSNRESGPEQVTLLVRSDKFVLGWRLQWCTSRLPLWPPEYSEKRSL